MRKHKFHIPCYEQSENCECGLCCLAMIMSYYYHEYTLNELRETYPIGRDGLNLLTIKKIVEKEGFSAKGFRIESIEDILFPAVLCINRIHFIVAEKRTKHGLKVIDPQRGRYEIFADELKEKSIVLGLHIDQLSSIQLRKVSSNSDELKKVIKGSALLIVLTCLLTLVLQMVTIAVPIGVRVMIDSLNQTGSKSNLQKVFPAFIAVIAIYTALNLAKGKLIISLQIKINRTISEKFVDKILKLPNRFFINRGTGDLLHRYTGVAVIREMLSNRIISVWLDIGIIILYCIYMTTISIKFTGTMIAFASIMIITSAVNLRKSKELLTKEVIEEAGATAYFNEIIQAISVVKMKGNESFIYNRWKILFDKQMDAMKKKGIFISQMTSVLLTIQFIAPIVLTGLGIHQVVFGNMTIGTVFSIYIASQGFYSPISSIVSMVNEIFYANSYFKRIIEVYNMKSEENLDIGIKNIGEVGKIAINNVSFQYSLQGKSILSNISAVINRGEFVGIVGETSSGKSTLAMLLMGLESPTKGVIYVDDNDLGVMNKKSLRKKIGVVSQNNYFFKQSIRENIAFGEEDITDSDLEQACKSACIWEDIQQMPMKFETILSENADNISGGQKQRLALARAIIKRPNILILDEATSALDNLTEKAVQNALNQIKCTRIVIAHRLETVRNADKILVMKNGQIVGMGVHQDLLKDNLYYKELYLRNMQA